MIDQPHFVYLLEGRRKKVLYVGCTVQPTQRLAHHRRNQPWADEIRSITWIWCATKRRALDLEKDLIWGHRPPYNDRGNPQPCPHCGRDFSALTRHTGRCRRNPALWSPPMPQEAYDLLLVDTAERTGIPYEELKALMPHPPRAVA